MYTCQLERPSRVRLPHKTIRPAQQKTAPRRTPEDKPLKLPDAVTFRQGSRASYRARVPSQRLDQIRKIFSTIDIDGSGCLDAAELQRAMAAMGVQKSMADIRLLIAEVDADQNGTVG